MPNSVTLVQPTRHTCERDGCDSRFAEPNAIEGSFCSQDCANRHRGGNLLAEIRRDHRFCATCFRPVKTVYRPDDADVRALRAKSLIVRDAFVGFETITEHADVGRTGTECNCGTCNQSSTEPTFRPHYPWEWWLSRAVDVLRETGAVEYELDVETLVDELWDGATLPAAIGAALQDPTKS